MIVKLQKSKIIFPSENFANGLAKYNIKLDEPLFFKYKLPKNMDEQYLQDRVRDFENNKTKKDFLILSNLLREIRSLNPELKDLMTIPMSYTDVSDALHGIASRFTVKDIQYYLSSKIKRKFTKTTMNIKYKVIEQSTGIKINFMPNPAITDKIISNVCKKIELKKEKK